MLGVAHIQHENTDKVLPDQKATGWLQARSSEAFNLGSATSWKNRPPESQKPQPAPSDAINQLLWDG